MYAFSTSLKTMNSEGVLIMCWQLTLTTSPNDKLSLWLAKMKTSCYHVTRKEAFHFRSLWSSLHTHVAGFAAVCATMSFIKAIFKLLVFASVAVLVVVSLRNWMATKEYVFNKEDIAKLVKQYAGESDHKPRFTRHFKKASKSGYIKCMLTFVIFLVLFMFFF